MSFSSNSWPVLSRNARYFASFRSCRTHLSRQRSSPFTDVEHGQHGEGPVGILRQAAIANLGKAPETLEGQERMLAIGTHTGLATVGGLVSVRQRAVLVGAFVGEVFCFRRNALESFALSLAPVGAVTVETGFRAMQQVRHFMTVMDIGGGDAGAMDQAALAV